MRPIDAGAIEILEVAPSSVVARTALRAYVLDVAARYYRRPATETELAEALAQHPTDALTPPLGFFLIASRGREDVVGCVGLATVAPGVGEVQRLHVDTSARGQGLGRRLMVEVEQRAIHFGLHELRLDTRNDLVESQSLYRSLGYESSTPHSGGPYSDLWFAKQL